MRGPLGSQMVLNGKTGVPWEKIFYYGMISLWVYWSLLTEKWTKEYLMIWSILFAVFRPPRPPPCVKPFILDPVQIRVKLLASLSHIADHFWKKIWNPHALNNYQFHERAWTVIIKGATGQLPRHWNLMRRVLVCFRTNLRLLKI